MVTGGKLDWLAVVLAMGFLVGAAADRLSVLPTKDPAPYHARVKAAAASVPTVIGEWTGHDTPDPGVEAYLRTNVFINRTYTASDGRQRFSLLIVQCPDVRDLVPHYPAVCYPGRGLMQTSKVPRDWAADGIAVSGTEYQFESNSFRQASGIVVENFMVLPTGQICRDMTDVKKQIPLRTRFYGAGQFQFVFSSGLPAEQRDKITNQLIAACKPLIGDRAGHPE